MPDETDAILAMHYSPENDAARADRARRLDPSRTWVDPKGYRLSDRLWQQGEETRAAIDRRLREGLSRGEDMLDVAVDLEKYLNPAFLPTRTVDGKIIHDGRRGVTTVYPRNGSGSVAARRLARTEGAYVAGNVTKEDAKALGLGVKWRLSGRHPEIDVCDDNASHGSRGRTDGAYNPADVPAFPGHPNCLCCLVTVDERTVDELVDYLRDKYDLPPTGVVHGTFTWGEENGTVGATFTAKRARAAAKSPKLPSVPELPADIRRPRGVGFTKPIEATDAADVADLKRAIQALPDTPSVDDIRAIGTKANDLVERRFAAQPKSAAFEEYEEVVAQRNALIEEFKSLKESDFSHSVNYYTRKTEIRSQVTELEQRRDVLVKKIKTPFQTKREIWEGTMQEVRDVNRGLQSLESRAAQGSTKTAIKALDDIANVFPQHWWEQGMGHLTRGAKMKRVERAYFRDRVGTLPADLNVPSVKRVQQLGKDYLSSTAMHETTHLMQRAVPDLARLEREWYLSRTNGGTDALEWMGKGYQSSETTRPDAFLHPYIGKDYGPKGSPEPWEVSSVGIQYVLGDPLMPLPTGKTAREADQDFIDFITGLFFGL